MIDCLRQAAADFRVTGDLHTWALATSNVLLASSYQGSFVQSEMHARDLVQLGQEGGDPRVECWGLYYQGVAQMHIGRLDKATASLKRAMNLADALQDYTFYQHASSDLARCYLRQDRLIQALAAFEVSQAFYAKHRTGMLSLTPLRNGLAEACLLAAERGEGVKRARWLRKAKRACTHALKRGKAVRPGLPEALRLRGTYEWLQGRPAAAQKWWERSVTLAQDTGQRYDLGMVHLEMGRRLGDRAHLQRAESILAEIGAEWGLACVRQALEEMG